MGIEDDIATLDQLAKVKRDEMNNHKKARDKFQDDMRKCQMRRDSFRDNARALIEKSRKLKDERARYNELTREAKANREAVKERIDEARASGVRDIELLKKERDQFHQQVVEYYAKSQGCHEEIERISEQIDSSRKLADEQHEQSLLFKEAADREHQEFVRCLNELKELENELPDTL